MSYLATYGTADHAATLTEDRHPGVQTAMAWLAFSHLPQHMQNITQPLYSAAEQLLERIPDDSAELTSAMNRLVEAKDWYMRAGIRSDEGKPGPVPRPATVVDPPSRFETARDEHLPHFGRPTEDVALPEPPVKLSPDDEVLADSEDPRRPA